MRRMIFAGLATTFLELPLPNERLSFAKNFGTARWEPMRALDLLEDGMIVLEIRESATVSMSYDGVWSVGYP